MEFITLTETEAQPLRDQMDKKHNCYCGSKEDLHSLPIEGYTPHPSGWNLRNSKYWLYVTCPKCGHQWSLWKLGATRKEAI